MRNSYSFLHKTPESLIGYPSGPTDIYNRGSNPYGLRAVYNCRMDSGQITIEYGKTWTPEYGNGFYVETSSYFSLNYNNTIWFDIYGTCPFVSCYIGIYKVGGGEPFQTVNFRAPFTNKKFTDDISLYNLYEESVFKIGIGNHTYNSSHDDEITSGAIYRIWVE